MLESKKEENSPQKRPPRWKIKVAKVRRVFETIRTRNPKLFASSLDACYDILEFGHIK